MLIWLCLLGVCMSANARDVNYTISCSAYFNDQSTDRSAHGVVTVRHNDDRLTCRMVLSLDKWDYKGSGACDWDTRSPLHETIRPREDTVFYPTLMFWQPRGNGNERTDYCSGKDKYGIYRADGTMSIRSNITQYGVMCKWTCDFYYECGAAMYE